MMILPVQQFLVNNKSFMLISFHLFMVVFAYFWLQNEVRKSETSSPSESSSKLKNNEKINTEISSSTKSAIYDKKSSQNDTALYLGHKTTKVVMNEQIKQNDSDSDVTNKNMQNLLKDNSKQDASTIIEKITKDTKPLNAKSQEKNESTTTISSDQTWRCACEGSFLPPALLRSFGGAEAIFKAGMGQCYHKTS